MPRLFDLAAGACALTSTALVFNAARVANTYNTADATVGWWWQSTAASGNLVEAVREFSYAFNPDTIGIMQVPHSSVASLAWAGLCGLISVGCWKLSHSLWREEQKERHFQELRNITALDRIYRDPNSRKHNPHAYRGPR